MHKYKALKAASKVSAKVETLKEQISGSS